MQVIERILHMLRVKDCRHVCLFCEYYDMCKDNIRGDIFHMSQDAVGNSCENAYQILSENGQRNKNVVGFASSKYLKK